MINIDYANLEKDYQYLIENDKHLTTDRLRWKILIKEVLVIRKEANPIGWLRFGYFWDTIPFMNMLALEESYHRRGYGTQLVRAWEDEMRAQKHDIVFTSTQSDENAQHFYRKIGYQDIGALLLPDEALEIILYKRLPR
jgi:ribosomal protein S18 acetylase RimI-like enzyme